MRVRIKGRWGLIRVVSAKAGVKWEYQENRLYSKNYNIACMYVNMPSSAKSSEINVVAFYGGGKIVTELSALQKLSSSGA